MEKVLPEKMPHHMNAASRSLGRSPTQRRIQLVLQTVQKIGGSDEQKREIFALRLKKAAACPFPRQRCPRFCHPNDRPLNRCHLVEMPSADPQLPNTTPRAASILCRLFDNALLNGSPAGCRGLLQPRATSVNTRKGRGDNTVAQAEGVNAGVAFGHQRH